MLSKVFILAYVVSTMATINVLYQWFVNDIAVVGNPQLNTALLFIILGMLLQKRFEKTSQVITSVK